VALKRTTYVGCGSSRSSNVRRFIGMHFLAKAAYNCVPYLWQSDARSSTVCCLKARLPDRLSNPGLRCERGAADACPGWLSKARRHEGGLYARDLHSETL
jgi:hypothetical protein